MAKIVAEFQHSVFSHLHITITDTGNKDSKGRFLITREGGHAFNYLRCARATEAEAREMANFLWTDAVTRTRNAQAV